MNDRNKTNISQVRTDLDVKIVNKWAFRSGMGFVKTAMDGRAYSPAFPKTND